MNASLPEKCQVCIFSMSCETVYWQISSIFCPWIRQARLSDLSLAPRQAEHSFHSTKGNSLRDPFVFLSCSRRFKKGINPCQVALRCCDSPCPPVVNSKT